MSSNPRPDVGSPSAATTRRSRLRGWSLRRRLLVGILSLFAVVCLLIGLVSTLAMRQYLVHQLDVQIMAVDPNGGGPPHLFTRPGDHPPAGEPLGTITAERANGVLDGRILDPVSSTDFYQPLTNTEISAVATVPADGKPHTVAVGDLGNYRMVARTTPAGTSITGLPMTTLQSAVWRLIMIETGVALAGILLAALASAAIVRLSLR